MAELTYYERLAKARDQYADILLDISLDPHPTYNIHGHSVSLESYQTMITEQLNRINALLAQEPFEVVSQANV